MLPTKLNRYALPFPHCNCLDVPKTVVSDLNLNSTIDLAGPDRINGTETAYEKIGNDWYRASYSMLYPESNADTVITSGIQRVQITGLGAQQGAVGILASLSKSTDIRGNVSTS